MHFQSTDFPGAWIIEPNVFQDYRGYFFESYNKQAFADHNLEFDFVQDNHARSEKGHVLRGFHFQFPPRAQAKLIRVTAGAIYDVSLDMRKGSPSFGKCLTIHLSSENFRQLLIPRGFAHAYLTLKPETEVQYKVDALYDPDLESGIFWNDPELQVSWPLQNPIISDKDKKLPLWGALANPFKFLN